MATIVKAMGVMEKLLSNGKKVLVEDQQICGQLRRHISVLDKNGELLSHRVKYQLHDKPLIGNTGTKFDDVKRLITIDSKKDAINDIVRERRTYTTYCLQGEVDGFYNVKIPKYKYPDIDANGNETAVFDIFKARFDNTYVVKGRALFNIDGTLSSTDNKALFAPMRQKYSIPPLFGLRCEYPPIK